MKRALIILMILVAAVTVGACNEESAHESAEIAEVMMNGKAVEEYIRYEYTLIRNFFQDEIDSPYWRNITRTAGGYGLNDARGADLLKNTNEYNAVMNVIRKEKERGRTVGSSTNALTLVERYNGQSALFDDAFFASNHLLMLDIARIYGVQTTVCQVKVTITQENVVIADIAYGGDSSLTAGSCGVLYLIAVPKECETLEVNWTYVPEWNPRYGEEPGYN